MPRILALVLLAHLLCAVDDMYADVTQGALRVRAADGRVVECPLTRTSYSADIAGMVAQVEVEQTFVNPFPEAIEAVYVFPLSHAAGVNGMRMQIGERQIVGALLKRADARAVYEKAVSEGRTTSLLEQERPNIFTQSIGNLPPGGDVRVRIAYVDKLVYDQGGYMFHLPLVVGPRYIPGVALAGAMPSGTGVMPDTDEVPDAARISPPVLPAGQRNGHTVTIQVRLDAGMAIGDPHSANHAVVLQRPTPSTATIALQPTDGIANKDFELRYKVAAAVPQVAVTTHVGDDGGWLLLAVQPAQIAERLAERRPRDLCFLVDTSGSMAGEPMAKVHEAMRDLLAQVGPQDRIQVITFASATHALFPDYVPATPEQIAAALAFSRDMQGGGGTEMLSGIRAVLDAPLDAARTRVAVMLTDGYIGNEAAIIADIANRGNDRLRFWCIGIGSSPNRFLVDGVAAAGGGMGVVLGLHDDSGEVIAGLMSRLLRSQMDNLRIDWGGLPISEVVPQRLPSLWSGQPVVVCARYAGDGSGMVTVHGDIDGAPAELRVPVTLPTQAPGNRAVRTLWARQRLGELRQRAMIGDGYDREPAITALSLEYGVMTEYTSFVAVDAAVVNPGGANRHVDVAVPLPEGMMALDLPVLGQHELEELDRQPGGSAVMDAAMGGQGVFMAIGAGGGGAGMFGSRSGGGRKRAVAHGGGSRASESTVDAGLHFLVRHQSPTGCWDPATYQDNCSEQPHCEAGQGGPDDTIALTGQAVLAFLGAGYDHKTPNRHKTVLARALAWLRSQEQADGSCGSTVEAQACATQALAEAYAMTNDPDLRVPAQLAVNRLLLARQAGADGVALAWGDATSFDTAASTSAIMALKSAYAAGLSVGDGLDRAKLWLDAAWQAANPGWQGLAPPQQSAFPAAWSPATGAAGDESEAGLCVAALLGHKPGSAMLETLTCGVLARRLPTGTAQPDDLRRIYLGSLGIFRTGGAAWRTWNTAVRDVLVRCQRAGGGCCDASWDAQGQVMLGSARGRLQSSLRALTSLEIYYQYGEPRK